MARPLATVYLVGDGVPLEVTESPLEVRELRRRALTELAAGKGDGLFELTLTAEGADEPGYLTGGRPVLVAGTAVSMIGPPLLSDD